jgi:hypothetical protein
VFTRSSCCAAAAGEENCEACRARASRAAFWAAESLQTRAARAAWAVKMADERCIRVEREIVEVQKKNEERKK